VKHDLKGVLKCIRVENLNPLPLDMTDITMETSQTVTDTINYYLIIIQLALNLYLTSI
jgi:hypothetical protein